MTTLFIAYFLVNLSVVAYAVRLGVQQYHLKRRIRAFDDNGLALRNIPSTAQRAA